MSLNVVKPFRGSIDEPGLKRRRPMADTEDLQDTPVLETLAEMTAASIAHSNLEARGHMIARIAALAAVNAPPASYLANASTSVGITLEDVQGVLVAVAPIVGAPRIVAAAGNIARALGFAIAAAEELIAEQDEG
jgi:hypothetical protein